MKKMKKKPNWRGAEPDGWKMSRCSACIECHEELLVDKDEKYVCFDIFSKGCSRKGLYTAIVERLKE